MPKIATKTTKARPIVEKAPKQPLPVAQEIRNADLARAVWQWVVQIKTATGASNTTYDDELIGLGIRISEWDRRIILTALTDFLKPKKGSKP